VPLAAAPITCPVFLTFRSQLSLWLRPHPNSGMHRWPPASTHAGSCSSNRFNPLTCDPSPAATAARAAAGTAGGGCIHAAASPPAAAAAAPLLLLSHSQASDAPRGCASSAACAASAACCSWAAAVTRCSCHRCTAWSYACRTGHLKKGSRSCHTLAYILATCCLSTVTCRQLLAPSVAANTARTSHQLQHDSCRSSRTCTACVTSAATGPAAARNAAGALPCGAMACSRWRCDRLAQAWSADCCLACWLWPLAALLPRACSAARRLRQKHARPCRHAEFSIQAYNRRST
jgi:hypothetical protein